MEHARELKKTEEHESDDYTNRNWCSWYCHQRIGTRTVRQGNNGMGGDYIIENGQNIEKNPGNLRGLAVSQIPVKDQQLKLMGKTFKE